MNPPCQTCIPALDYDNDNPLAVTVPDSFVLPQVNPYCANLTVEELTLLIAGLLAMSNYIGMSAATLTTNAKNFSCLPQELQVPAFLWTLNQVILNLSPPNAGRVYQGNYGSAGPLFTPDSAGSIAIDVFSRRQWMFANGYWS